MNTRWILAAVMSAAAAVAVAKLPPLTPEQLQSAEVKKADEKAKAEKEKVLLDKAQDRVVEYYKRSHPSASGGVAPGAGTTKAENVSRKAIEPARSAGPIGGTAQSAEAHSTPAK